MNLFLLAVRNVLRNRHRSVATVLAIAAGLTALNLFAGYIANVYAGLQIQAVAGERLGHLTIYKEGMLLEGKLHPKRYMFDAAEMARVRKAVEAVGGVRMVSPRISVSGMASNGNNSTIFIGEGIVAADAQVLRGALTEGAGGRLDPARQYGVAVSADLAKLLNYGVGSTLTLMTSTIDGQANAMDAQVIDVFNTGNANTNDKYLVLPFGFVQSLLDTDSAERFVVLLADASQTEVKRAELLARLQAAGFKVEIKTWQELSSFYTQVRNLFDMIFAFIASIVFVIAAMSIANTISMTVIERTREIGTLRALGLRGFGVVRLFACEALALAGAGIALGLGLTIAIATLVNRAGISYVPPNSSSAVALLVDLDWARIAGVGAVVLLLAMAAAVLPSWRAARRGIVDALSFA
ncbi:ABC transporter permease [Massilia horti]|uniref:ABC transporter permease n=1 Tax=Massilia horti TaxID=2562153 RepID=A0A4Y9SW13_9BURK|nr:FtsX-like permease family protein [Massilia horti]TFW28926.1 ABC transporter permease [Massilia horti]